MTFENLFKRFNYLLPYCNAVAQCSIVCGLLTAGFQQDRLIFSELNYSKTDQNHVIMVRPIMPHTEQNVDSRARLLNIQVSCLLIVIYLFTYSSLISSTRPQQKRANLFSFTFKTPSLGLLGGSFDYKIRLGTNSSQISTKWRQGMGKSVLKCCPAYLLKQTKHDDH